MTQRLLPTEEHYHTALHPHRPHGQALDRVERPSGVAFVHDIMQAPLPSEYAACDVLYTDLPWRDGFNLFEKRAGLSNGRKYTDFLASVSSILLANRGRLAVIVTGKHARPYLPTPRMTLASTLNGEPCILLVYHCFIPPAEDTVSLLHRLAERYECVGDFCCGYGRAGRIFNQHGKRFVMSDFNAECIGHIGATL